MNNILNGSVTSIERMAEVISKRKKQDVNATYDGPSFTEILSRQLVLYLSVQVLHLHV